MAGSAGHRNSKSHAEKEGWKELGVTCRNTISSSVVRLVCRLLVERRFESWRRERRTGGEAMWIVGMREAGGKRILGRDQGWTREDFGFSFTCPAGGGADLAPKGCRGMCAVGEKN